MMAAPPLRPTSAATPSLLPSIIPIMQALRPPLSSSRFSRLQSSLNRRVSPCSSAAPLLSQLSPTVRLFSTTSGSRMALPSPAPPLLLSTSSTSSPPTSALTLFPFQTAQALPRATLPLSRSPLMLSSTTLPLSTAALSMDSSNSCLAKMSLSTAALPSPATFSCQVLPTSSSTARPTTAALSILPAAPLLPTTPSFSTAISLSLTSFAVPIPSRFRSSPLLHRLPALATFPSTTLLRALAIGPLFAISLSTATPGSSRFLPVLMVISPPTATASFLASQAPLNLPSTTCSASLSTARLRSRSSGLSFSSSPIVSTSTAAPWATLPTPPGSRSISLPAACLSTAAPISTALSL